MKQPYLPLAAFIAPAAMMLLALADMPYAYYTFLKIVAMLTAGWIAVVFYDWRRGAWGGAFALLAVTFNPIIPIHPGREVWFFLNIAAAILYLSGIYVLLVERREQREFDAKYNQPKP